MNGKPSESSKRRFQSSPKVVAQIDLIKMNKNGDKEATQDAVSYTHLTLPTILRV